jgi:hypothetical protein
LDAFSLLVFPANRRQWEDGMATASGMVIETPTAEFPFKATITHGGEVILERRFESRPAAESYLVETLKGLEDRPERISALKAVREMDVAHNQNYL